LNRGPHRPELWANPTPRIGKSCKSRCCSCCPPPLRTSDIAVDSRGFGREIDSLANDEHADAGSLGHPPAGCSATARAALQVPNRRVTTLAAGHSPSVRRASASPPPRLPCALDQDRARMAALAVGVRVALAVARLGIRPAAAAHPSVAGLDRPRLLAGRLVEVRLHRRRRAIETVGDLPDPDALGLAVMTAPGATGLATLEKPTRSRG
jgi:hypothetical protein